jgi:ketosteroid isomerase-like protein
MTHVQLVEHLLRSVGRNDVDGAVAVCSPDLVFVDVLARLEETVRDVRGEMGLRDWFDGLHERGVKQVTAEPMDLEDLGDGRVIGAMRVTQKKTGHDFSSVVYGIWTIEDGRIAKIDSFFDRDLALRAAGTAEGGPTRRWVEGVVTAKAVDRRTVRLRSPEHDGSELSVRDSDVWKAIEVGAMGIAETDAGELVGWRSLEPPRR